MNSTPGSTRIPRRRLLAGTAATAGAAALAACAPDHPDAVDADEIIVNRVDRVPADDPDADAWGRTPEKTVEMASQEIALPHRTTPAVETIRIRAIHDGETIGFRVDWDDREIDDMTVRVDDFRDACAVLLAPGAGDETVRTMGTATTAATLLHWKADWQRDIDSGRAGLDDAYPNRSVDAYPPLVDVVPGEATIEDYADAGATQWLPGTDVGNPMSASRRETAVEKIVANGYGTSTTTPTQDARGRGDHRTEGWRVTLTKPLGAADDGETTLSPGGEATCAFAVWAGADGDAGSRKSPSATVYRLTIVA